jgi:hypothetical protein
MHQHIAGLDLPLIIEDLQPRSMKILRQDLYPGLVFVGIRDKDIGVAGHGWSPLKL